MNSVCVTRLRKEYKEIQKKRVDNIFAAPRESNILEWHYVIVGPTKTPYEGGYFHGTVVFPSEYPYKPPSIQMFTPNGRFKTATRLCLSMSDFHPESWNPMWSVGTILMGLYSFMLEETPTYGSIITSDAFRRKCAKESMIFNIKNKHFVEIFPDLVNEYSEKLKESVSDNSESQINNNTSWATIIGILAAILAFTYAILVYSL